MGLLGTALRATAQGLRRHPPPSGPDRVPVKIGTWCRGAQLASAFCIVITSPNSVPLNGSGSRKDDIMWFPGLLHDGRLRWRGILAGAALVLALSSGSAVHAQDTP